MKLKELLNKYKGIIRYVFFGALTTVISIAVYSLFYDFLKIGNTPSNVISWIAAVSFAFVTNKVFVFEKRSWEKRETLREMGSFFLMRIGTGVLEIALMFLLVDIARQNGTLMKCIVTVIVIILNYVASKWFVFNK